MNTLQIGLVQTTLFDLSFEIIVAARTRGMYEMRVEDGGGREADAISDEWKGDADEHQQQNVKKQTKRKKKKKKRKQRDLDHDQLSPHTSWSASYSSSSNKAEEEEEEEEKKKDSIKGEMEKESKECSHISEHDTTSERYDNDHTDSNPNRSGFDVSSSTPLLALPMATDPDKDACHASAAANGLDTNAGASPPASNPSNLALWGYGMIAISACTQAVRAALFHGAMTRSTISPSASLFLSGITFTVLSVLGILFFNLQERVMKTPRKQVLQLVLRGLISGVMVFTNTFALSLIPVGTALTLFATAPAITSVLAAIFLNDPLTVTDAAVLLANLVGVTLVARPSTVSSQTSTVSTVTLPKHSLALPFSGRQVSTAWDHAIRLGFTNSSLSSSSSSSSSPASASAYALANADGQALRQALIGVIVALATAFLIASAYTLVKAMGTRVHFILNLLSIGLGCLFVSMFLVDATSLHVMIAEPYGTLTILAGATAGFIAQALLNRAVQLCRPGPALVVRSMNVPVSIALGWIFFHESVPATTFLGTIIVLFSVIYIGLSHIWRNAARASVSSAPPRNATDPTVAAGFTVQPAETAVATYGAVPQVLLTKPSPDQAS